MSNSGRRPRLATVWLGGCSGCHMSFLDTDEWLFDLSARADIVYGPLVDAKEFPTDVDVTLVEGAVANVENLDVARQVRERSRVVVSFGDCAITGNVTALRNPLGEPVAMLRRVYVDAVDVPITPERGTTVPNAVVPALLPQVRPLHTVIDVDVWLPGCPPPAERIRAALEGLLNGAADGDVSRGGRVPPFG